MCRRWRVLVIDDRQAPVTPILRELFYGNDREVIQNVANCVHGYAVPEEAALDMANRRRLYRSAWPMLDTSKSLQGAYDLVTALFDQQLDPDIVFLDVDMEQGGEPAKDHPVWQFAANADYQPESILSNGGNVLEAYIGHKYASCLERMPLVVKNTAHSVARRYAAACGAEVMDERKQAEPSWVRGKIEQRLRDILMHRVSPQSLTSATVALEKAVAMNNDAAIKAAINEPIGDDWVLGSLFVLQAERLAVGTVDEVAAAVQEVRSYVDEVDYGRLLTNLFDRTYLKVICHNRDAIRYVSPSGQEMGPFTLANTAPDLILAKLPEVTAAASRLEGIWATGTKSSFDTLLNEFEQGVRNYVDALLSAPDERGGLFEKHVLPCARRLEEFRAQGRLTFAVGPAGGGADLPRTISAFASALGLRLSVSVPPSAERLDVYCKQSSSGRRYGVIGDVIYNILALYNQNAVLEVHCVIDVPARRDGAGMTDARIEVRLCAAVELPLYESGSGSTSTAFRESAGWVRLHQNTGGRKRDVHRGSDNPRRDEQCSKVNGTEFVLSFAAC